ncbi:MAG: carboxylating nicotinate-nucleotide diphosphorylase [Methanimicrococcus sp.]|nr:carboxylating nicotinate-nucleotide diphosphorylase [Methanimicrococcus sp.]
MIFQKEIEYFLEEDLREEDVSCTLVGRRSVRAVIFTKAECVLSGVEVAAAILEYMGISYAILKNDGERAEKGDVIFELSGDSVSILRAERLVLNFISHLSGIATNTNRYVQIVGEAAGARAPKIAATRKTTPGLRKYEKKAVVDGGGDSHRQSLSDLVMIKDNHIEIAGLENAFLEAKRSASFCKKIEVEADTIEQAARAAELGADIVLLDNMSPALIREVIVLLEERGLRKKVLLEASGGIQMENLGEYATTGVDVISLSAVTNDARWIDVGLDVLKS